MKESGPARSEVGTVVGVMGLVMSLISPFLPWIVTKTETISLYQTGWWIAPIPVIVFCSCGFTRYLGRRVRPIAFSLAGLVVVIENIGAFTTVLPTLGENSLALGFYVSLASASLLLEGGIATYLEETREGIDVSQDKEFVVSRLCRGCGNDLSEFSPNLHKCPFCRTLLESTESTSSMKQKEVIVVEPVA